MSWNRLKSKGVGAIAEAFVGLGAAASLETIDFSHNNIDDAHENVIPLADLLLCNSIHSVDFSHNNLGPVFAKKLRENLSLSTCEARQVNVGFNPLGTFETAHIIEAMKLNKVRQLRLENTCSAYSGGEEDLQYVFELSERVARAKNVLFMIKSRRKVKVNIQTEYPAKKRVQRSKLINSMMGWMNKKRKHKGITKWSGGNNNLVNHGEDWHSLHVGDESDDEEAPQMRAAALSISTEYQIVIPIHTGTRSRSMAWLFMKLSVLDHTKKTCMSKHDERKIHDILKENYILLRESFMFYAATETNV